MALADLHVHSIHSEHPSEWFLQRLGAAESYTDPIDVFRMAKNNGMNFVTITDHNRISGALLLQMQFPDLAFTSVETTAYFPEDGCKVHILIYGLNEKQFNEIQLIRKDIYQLQAYLFEEKLACSVAHATYSVNNRITIGHLEKLILLFDVFESINGGRNKVNNEIWTECLQSLNADIITDLSSKYKIKPMSNDPWIKGFTGGSDDHAGFFGATTYTYAEAENIADFLSEVKNKKTFAGGRHNDFKSLAFTIYKIGYDFSKTKSNNFSNPIIKQITENIFESKKSSFFDKFNFNTKISRKSKQDSLKNKLLETISEIHNFKSENKDYKFDFIYNKFSELGDEFFIQIADKVVKNLNNGDLFNLLKDVSSALPGIFLAMPFFTTMKHMFSGRDLIVELQKRYPNNHKKNKKILWFSDTINDLNGISFILKKIVNLAHEYEKNIFLVSSLNDNELKTSKLPKNFINLPYIYNFNLPLYESYNMRIPSILKCMEIISQENPDELYISTPGPVGLMGLLIGRLLSIKVSGVYHTDFKQQVNTIDEEGGASDIVESYTKWFYSSMDSIKVPTLEYISILSERGFDSAKMSLFKRGIEEDLFYPVNNAKTLFSEKYGIKKGFNLLYVGRVSKDKNLDFLFEVYKELFDMNSEINLIIVGDGPSLDDLMLKNKKFKQIYYLGKVEHNDLALIYSGSDLFMFPSTTDTFGMVVLEAQACGLPAIVSDIGGPKEIIANGKSGYIVKANSHQDWVKITFDLIAIHERTNQEFNKMKLFATNHVKKNNNWLLVLDEIVGTNKQSID